jgi:hypothetical protein
LPRRPDRALLRRRTPSGTTPSFCQPARLAPISPPELFCSLVRAAPTALPPRVFVADPALRAAAERASVELVPGRVSAGGTPAGCSVTASLVSRALPRPQVPRRQLPPLPPRLSLCGAARRLVVCPCCPPGVACGPVGGPRADSRARCFLLRFCCATARNLKRTCYEAVVTPRQTS